MPDSFTIVFSLSAAASLAWLGYGQPPSAGRLTTPQRLVAAGSITLIGALLGARLVYIASHWNYYQYHLQESVEVWTGGLSGFGGCLGAILGLLSFARLAGEDFWCLADAMVRPASVMSAAVWAGCWLTDCAYGKPLTWGLVSPDIFGRLEARWPSALIAAAASGAWAWALPWMKPGFDSQPRGIQACLTLSVLGGIMLLAGLLRADPTMLYGGIRQEIWGATFIIILALTALIALRRKDEGENHECRS